MSGSVTPVRQQIAYVIAGDSLASARRYVDGACLSIHSLRRLHPTASVVCACDQHIYAADRDTGHPLPDLVDRLIECSDASGGPVHRSRHIKTSLRPRIERAVHLHRRRHARLRSVGRTVRKPERCGIHHRPFFPECPRILPCLAETILQPPADTRVISFRASQQEMAALDEAILERFAVDRTVDHDRLVELTSPGTAFVRQRKAWSRQLWDRLAVGIKFMATRYRLWDPRGE